ncbi:MAG: cofactor-independent phosphoglycerate mutase [Clostridia bacterium]|nr:cofactor-independent phosphoglycerate mutase [Clostridia bacterium]
MKYVVILGDGMADYRQPFLNGKTPLMLANKPFIDRLAKSGEVGLCKTVPCGMKPGSDVANLSVLGYNPKECYSGRSPLEAASIGIDIKDTDITARANLVTVSNEPDYRDKTMIDYSAGEISTAEAKELIEFLAKKLNDQKYTLYSGISYRHCLVIDNGVIAGDLTPPHDITGKPVKEYLPKSEQGLNYLELMKKSHELLKDHPVNLKRIADGKRPANSLWFWGEGTKPCLQSFKEKFNLNGGIISAVDLLKGIGILADMKVIEVEGATGNYDTNFSGKAKACLNALKDGLDLVYLHMEAPDECGHHGDTEHKIYSIEQIDKVVEYIAQGLKDAGEEFRMLITPDHPTPLSIMTHCSDPVPYILCGSGIKAGGIANSYDEEQAEKTGVFVEEGHTLMQKLISK